MDVERGILDVEAYLKWYARLVAEEGAPQYISNKVRVNPVYIEGTDHDDDEGASYHIHTADRKVSACIPARFIRIVDTA